MHTSDVHKDEMSDGIDTLWGGDDMGSGTDEDDSDGDMEEESFVSPPPSEDDIERQIRDESIKGKLVVYYESLKGELKTKTTYGYRCDERIKTNVKESTRLASTPLCPELEHLKTETSLLGFSARDYQY